MQKKIFNQLFFYYIRYLKYELADSICQTALHPKEANILISFRDTFYAIITSYEELQEEEWKKLIKNLRKNISDYMFYGRNYYLKLDLIKVLRSELNFFGLIDDDFKEVLSDYSNSCDDFRALDRIRDEFIQRRFAKDEKDRSVLMQALLEFNNAFSHLAIIFYNGKDSEGNLQKAKNHLYRGCLDNYKMLLRFILPIINNKSIMESFVKIREQEFLLLGRPIDDKIIEHPYLPIKEKVIISKAYKELFNIAFNKIPKEYIKNSVPKIN